MNLSEEGERFFQELGVDPHKLMTSLKHAVYSQVVAERVKQRIREVLGKALEHLTPLIELQADLTLTTIMDSVVQESELEDDKAWEILVLLAIRPWSPLLAEGARLMDQVPLAQLKNWIGQLLTLAKQDVVLTDWLENPEVDPEEKPKEARSHARETGKYARFESKMVHVHFAAAYVYQRLKQAGSRRSDFDGARALYYLEYYPDLATRHEDASVDRFRKARQSGLKYLNQEMWP